MTGSGSPLLVILGPTAVGKTDLAIRLAQHFGGEIVGADSRQLYRTMDIGTAKPTLEQLASAPHHLIDIAEPDEDVSLPAYKRLATNAIDSIHERGALPILVGGTGQYITALLEGWTPPEVPPNFAQRAELEAEAAIHGAPSLYARLVQLDPDVSGLIDPKNLRRIIRALEVIDATGQPFSAQRTKSPPNYRVRVIGLTMDRDSLRDRADIRLDQMMEAGFLDEVRLLLDHGYSPRLPSMSAVGYVQLVGHLLNGVAMDETMQLARKATHNFIRRQFSWFRGHDHDILWHNMDELDLPSVMKSTERWLSDQA